MNWREATAAMRAGKHVRRQRDAWKQAVTGCEVLTGSVPITETGTEPCYLAAVWLDRDEPARAFMGSWSRVPFIPDHEHLSATDWEVVEP